MRVIADQNLAESISSAFVGHEEENFTVIYLERGDRQGQRSRSIGFDDVLSIAPEGNPVLMLGWLDPIRHYRQNPKWHASLACPKVVFVHLPANAEDLLTALSIAKHIDRPTDPLALALLSVEDVQNQIGILHHDLYHAEQRGEVALTQWEERAREILGNRVRSDLIQVVRESVKQGHPPGQFDGQEFPDTCVDVEGTLFDDQNEIREDVLAMVRQFSKNSPITVWSGGDVKVLNKTLSKAGIPYKLISKGLMRGTKVGVVIDDLPEEFFRDSYGVSYGKYVKV